MLRDPVFSQRERKRGLGIMLLLLLIDLSVIAPRLESCPGVRQAQRRRRTAMPWRRPLRPRAR